MRKLFTTAVMFLTIGWFLAAIVCFAGLHLEFHYRIAIGLTTIILSTAATFIIIVESNVPNFWKSREQLEETRRQLDEKIRLYEEAKTKLVQYVLDKEKEGNDIKKT